MRSFIARLVGTILVVTVSVTASTGKESTLSTSQSMNLLKEGNARYVKGEVTYPHQDADYLTRTASAQHPVATILSCADSRVPVEQVFDMGIGDLFVVRVAGNIAGINELASLEYGVDHLGTPTLLVLGHSNCGAVTAAATSAASEGSVGPILEKLAPAVERAAKANPSKSGKALVPAAITENIWLTIESIFARSVAIRQRVVEGKLKVLGGIYHLSDGHIEWLGSHPKQTSLLVNAYNNEMVDQDEQFYVTADYQMPSISKAAPQDGETPESALALLKDGNSRFVDAQRTYPNQDWDRMQAVMTDGQHPYAAVLTCSDSRLPVEHIYDAGLGDIFVVRVAGNVAGLMETGSLEYAIEHLETPLVVVLGHSSCGAVTAVANHAEMSGAIPELVDRIQPAVAKVTTANPAVAGKELIEKSVDANIWQTISDLYAQSPEICARVKAGRLAVVGAKYHLENGSIDWLGNHPDQTTLISATLAKCDGNAVEHADATDDLPAVEQETKIEIPAKAETVTTPVAAPEAQATTDGKPVQTLGAALDRLQQQVDALQQTQQPAAPAPTAAPKSVEVSKATSTTVAASDQMVTFQQQLQQLQSDLRKLTEQVQANRLADSTIAAILSDIEVLKAENNALRGFTEQASQKLASIDDDVYAAPTNENYQLERFAGIVDELSAVVEKAKVPAKPAINSPEVKRGSITMFGLLNQQYYERGGDSKLSTFDNKRARLGFTGALNNYAKITIHGEFAKSVKLLDGFVTLTPNKEWSFKFGQMQPAFGQNFLRSPAIYTVITPSLAMALGSDRDIGAQVAWDHSFSKKFGLQLTAGLYNGAGINVSDSNSAKNSVVRAQMKIGSALTLGANNYSGKSNKAVNPGNVDTWGSFANWTWKSEEVEAEYIHTKAAGVKKAGWYVWGGHMLKTNWKFVPEVQLVARYEEYDANRAVVDNKVNRTTIGTTFYIDKKYTLIQLNYQFNGEEGTNVKNNEFLANFQVGF
ncbi:MAG: hypothetical protein IPH75_09695 [bacterium]|nr:hypothetical protein [bacterium]